MSSAQPLPKPVSGQPCSCGSGIDFALCCEPIISGKRPAATAEQLMRARFTAHVANENKFLHYTYLPSSRQPFVEDDGVGPLGWTKLVIHSHEPDVKPGISYVDFTAYYAEKEATGALHEKSEFQLIDGKWLFTRTLRQGPAPIKSSAPKAGRNDPCPCGSGKKYKQCCLGKA
ncbi:YchJ family protein [Rariglobus hedericola]|uniref:YchJ family protein n=1 Tax=Rariglobus hedericola TaxID=2597822 RepID=UPI0023B1A465|nr:YchJ family metal-binding protein [Rariglobus hedericola]